MSIKITETPAAPAAPATGTPAPVVTETPTGGMTVTPPAPGTPATPPVTPPATPPAAPAAPATPPTPRIETPKEAPKIDLSKVFSEMKDGKLSDKAYADAEKQGIARADLDTFVAGHKAKVDGVANALSEIAGGQENLQSLMTWAGANTDEATRNAFNDAIDRADSTVASLMVRGLLAQYNDAVGVEGTRITGNGPTGGVQPFENWDQVRAEMRKPAYDNDPAFRETISKRLAISFNG